jgi:hypothetical protein
MPDIHLHFEGGQVPSRADAAAAGRAAAEAFAREVAERTIHWKSD